MGSWRGKRVFISGGAGVIGTVLVKKLLQEEAVLWVGDLKPSPAEWEGHLHYWQGDLNHVDGKLLADFDPEYAFHLAAAFERTEESPEFFGENFHHNVQLTHHLFGCLKGCFSLKRLLFASSYLVYNPALYLVESPPKRPVVLSENAALLPRNLCGAAKLFGERELLFLGEEMGLSVRIFRSYGRGSRDIVSRSVRAALRGEPITLYQPESLFDYIVADDVAEALLRLAITELTGSVNLGSGRSRRVGELFEQLKGYFPDLIVKEQRVSALYEAAQAEMSHFQQSTGWLPSSCLERALPEIIQFERERL